MKTLKYIILIGCIQFLLVLGCSLFPSAPDSEQPRFSFIMKFGKLPSPNYAGVNQHSETLNKITFPDAVDKARVMVIDNSSYVMFEELTATSEWEAYEKDKFAWKGDLGLWNEWVDLIGGHFPIVTNTTLDIEGTHATGTIKGVLGLNSFIVGLEDGGRIRYWGEAQKNGFADSTQTVYIYVDPHNYFEGGMPDTSAQQLSVDSIAVIPKEVTLQNNEAQAFTCRIHYSDGTYWETNYAPLWSTSPGMAGTISTTGYFVADGTATGTETVTATYSTDNMTYTDQSIVTVINGVAQPFDTTGHTVLYQEDFEGYDDGMYPDGWNIIYNGVSGAVSSQQAASGQLSFRQESNPNSGRRDEIPIASPPLRISYELNVMLRETDKGTVIGLHDADGGPWGMLYAYVEFLGDGRLTAGENRMELLNYNPDTWYHIKVLADLDNGLMDVYLDGELVYSDVGQSNISYDSFALGYKNFTSGTSVQYYDDIRITTW
ncbi:hypothetical protein JW835_00200 [bacterium]|nr:hypothetical protein [bacterium]